MTDIDKNTSEMRNQIQILVVEDDRGLLKLIEKRLTRDGYRVKCAASGKEAVDILSAEAEMLLLLDYRLGDITGKELIDRLLEKDIQAPFIIMTGHGDERTAVEMMKRGARDYLIKDEAFIDILPRVLDNVLNRLLIEQKLQVAKLALQESEKRFRLIFNSGSDAIFLNEVQDGKPGRFIEVNEIACKKLGYSREELLQMTPADIEDADWKREHPVASENLHRKKSLLYEMIYVNRNGKRIPMEISSQLIDFGGKPAFLSVSRDITERKHLEEQLRQAQKMEAIGKLAGGVAHDFNNLLTTINGYAEFIILKMDDDNPFKEGLAKIKRAGERAATLTQQLLAFGRKQMLQPELLDLNRLIGGMEKILKKLIGDEIQLVQDLSEDIMQIRADPGLMEQIILNLVINGSDAMKAGDSLAIKTENRSIDDQQTMLLPGSRPGRFVCLSISDTGLGIDNETLRYIFEPFFTTKEMGTGLGLSVVYGIVKQHNGWVNVYSEQGKGTIFRIFLPAFTSRTQEEMEEKALFYNLSGNGEKILFVEQEDDIRHMTVRSLRDHGYEVFATGNVKEAKEIFEKQKGDFRLCFSNMSLPDRSGIELAEELLTTQPDLKVLLSSEQASQGSPWLQMHGRGLTFLQKPYSLADLLIAIKETLK